MSDPDADSIPVRSTDGFPESGRLSVQNEIIGYKRKTPTRFEGLSRQMHNTMPLTGSMLEDLTTERRELYAKRPNNVVQLDRSTHEKLKPYLNRPLYLSKGIIITSFDARIVPEDKREQSMISGRYTKDNFPGNFDSILQWQRHTDVYIAVVRKPDQAHLRAVQGEYELIPGENHWETRGYNIYKDGEKITKKLLSPGTLFKLPGAGRYTAVAVEWSGLESVQSVPLTVQESAILRIQLEKPGDFQWTTDRWLVDGNEVSESVAKGSETAVREIVHLVDGVIHREWYNWGQIVKRHDLNAMGKAIRRLFYRNGILERREYHNRAGQHVSTELFAPDGYITEAIRYKYVDSAKKEIGHWWYEKGMPVKLIGSEGHTLVAFPGIYTREGKNWVWRELK